MITRIFSSAILLFFGFGLAENSFAQINIIQIIADDLGWTDLSSGQSNLGNGSPYYQTPNIDSLAAGGMAFSSYYALPTCSPTRAALLTGQYSPRNGIHQVASLNTIGDTTLLVEAANGRNIKDDATTIGELLQTEGYITCHVGKFHCTDVPDDIITEHGFDFNLGGTSSGGPNGNVPYFAQQNANNGQWTFASAHGPEFDAYADPYTQQYIDDNLVPYANGNDPSTLLNTPKHLNDAMADATIGFLADRVADSEPFFVNVAFNAIHTEINSRPDLETKYNGITGSTMPQHDDPAYAGLLEGMDQAIGRIVDYVDQNGLGSNTLIVFVSDNGGTNASDNFPLQSSKGSFYQGGIRVPMMAFMPGTIPAGTTSDEAIHAVDFYKTYASFANATLPDPNVHTLDGESFVDILNGSQTDLVRDTVFYHFPGYTNQFSPCSIAIHDGSDGNRYKLFYYYEDRSFEFYDLTNDIGEATDLMESGMTQVQFDISRTARIRLTNWLHESNAELPTVRATGESVPLPSHSPDVEYLLDTAELGATLDGQEMGTVSHLDVALTAIAEGENPSLSSDGSGIGVNSDLDSGGPNMRQRIDGSLSNPEGMVIAFDQDVLLKQLNIRAMESDGSESLQIQFFSGENPFSGLAGYNADGFTLSADALTYVRTSGTNVLSLRMAQLGQDEILVKAGTTLRITADPAVDGGLLLESISVALPAATPSVASVSINDGAGQRSAIENVSLTFEGIVEIESDAISVLQRGDIDTPTGTAVDSSLTISTSGNETTVNVTFDSLTRGADGFLVDGNYQLNVDRTKVRIDGLQMQEDFVFGDEEVERFFALYGDSNGDRTINIFDLLVFRQTYLAVAGDPSYDYFMDFDAGGVVNVIDLLQFRRNYLVTLPFVYDSGRSSKSLASPIKGKVSPVSLSATKSSVSPEPIQRTLSPARR